MTHICDGRDPSCVSCKALARRLDTVRSAMTLEDDLDDIKRARIWTQLADRVAEAPAVRRSTHAIAIGVAAAIAVAAAALVALWSPRDEPRALTVPAGTVVASRLGPHTFASIVGPAQLEILARGDDATAVRLHRGTLLAEFEGGAGRSLRVETRGALIEVVGTLFAVEVRGATTCTSVVHGRVRVATAAGLVYVAAGERHCTGEAIGPIADEMRAALTRLGSRSGPAVAALSSASATATPAATARAPAARPSQRHAEPPAARPTATAAAPPSAPPPAEPVAPGAPATPALDDDQLYRLAEAALAVHDLAAADRALAALVTEHPGSALVDEALYERARIAYQQHAWAAARDHLARLASIASSSSSSFAEPGHYLRCRIAVETREPTAESCLIDYRAAFPRSPHDLDALALLVQLGHARAGCGGAAALVDDLVQRYPRAALAAAWRARCPSAQ